MYSTKHQTSNSLQKKQLKKKNINDHYKQKKKKGSTGKVEETIAQQKMDKLPLKSKFKFNKLA